MEALTVGVDVENLCQSCQRYPFCIRWDM